MAIRIMISAMEDVLSFKALFRLSELVSKRAFAKVKLFTGERAPTPSSFSKRRRHGPHTQLAQAVITNPVCCR
jgi:hypothetical protein